jgi:hypothetical protein
MPAANPLRGEVGFTAAGQERILRFGINEICVLEAELGMGFGEIIRRLSADVSITIVRTVFRRAILGEEITADEAGAMIDELTLPGAIELLMKSHDRSSPDPREANGSRPPKRAQPAPGKSTFAPG